MNTVRIVTDSTADIPQDYCARLNLHVIPCFVNIGQRSYRDVVDIARADFYRAMPSMTEVPHTSGPPSGEFAAVYAEVGADGTDIVSLHPPLSVSGIFNSARIGAKECGLPEGRVHVVDAGLTSMGLGWQVMAAGEWAAQGASAAEIVQRLAELGPRTYVFAALDSMEYLRRSGRVNWMQSQLGALLQLKLIVQMYCGQVTMFDRVRTRRRAHEHMAQAAQALGPLEHAAVMHSGLPEEAAGMQQRMAALVPGTDVPVVEATPAIVAHVGPQALGLAVVRSEVRSPKSEVENGA